MRLRVASLILFLSICISSSAELRGGPTTPSKKGKKGKTENINATDEERCLEYCTVFKAATGRCPYSVSFSGIDACVEECMDAPYSKDGTKQDFALQDTLQCRQNHATIAIKEGALTNSFHCVHAMPEGAERCNPQDPQAVGNATLIQQGKYLFYNKAAILDGPQEEQTVKMILATTYLIALRGRLFASYPYLDVRSDKADQLCDESRTKYRMADGMCNSMDMPLMGSTDTPFVHSLEASSPHPSGYADVERVAKILKRESRKEEDPALLGPFNQLVSAWIQFMTHDWFVHGDKDEKGGSQLHNKVTHWWDASQIYGSTPKEVAGIRSEGGKIHLDENNELDYLTNKPLTGFGDNFWVGLHVMHTTFAREHNFIVDELTSTYPAMADDEKYGAARLCISAILAKIHTLEWTNTLLDNPVSQFSLTTNWYGLVGAAKKFFRPEDLEKYAGTLSSLKVPHFGGDDFSTDQTMFNTSFFMTEEFVSGYRMHPLLPDELKVGDKIMKLGKIAFEDAWKLVKENTTKISLLSDCHVWGCPTFVLEP